MADFDATDITLLVLDVDGVLTDGLIHIDARGIETKTFHTRDGLGIRLWLKLGGEIAFITGRSGMSVKHRADELGIRHVFQNVGHKGKAFDQVTATLDISPNATAVLGDDLPDLPMLDRSGYPMAVADACAEVRAAAQFVTVRPGGQGAVREAVEHLLKLQGRWEDALSLYE